MSKKIAVIIEVDEDAVKSASEMESLTDAIDSELGWVSASGLAIQGWSYLPEEPEDPTFTVCSKVQGYVRVPTKASTPEAAVAEANQIISDADFGPLSDIDWETYHVCDADGNHVGKE